MPPLWLFQAGALVALGIAAVAFYRQLRILRQLPAPSDRAPAKGDPTRGVIYALTLGMAPWSKESTRLHPVSYLRGIAFHIGIFSGLLVLAASPWLGHLPASLTVAATALTGLGAVFGAVGLAVRILDPNLRRLSTLDDLASVALVSLFLAAAVGALLAPAALPGFYLVTIALLLYAPLSKIRHCLYFAFSRIHFGRFVGRRGVLPHPSRRAASP